MEESVRDRACCGCSDLASIVAFQEGSDHDDKRSPSNLGALPIYGRNTIIAGHGCTGLCCSPRCLTRLGVGCTSQVFCLSWLAECFTARLRST